MKAKTALGLLSLVSVAYPAPTPHKTSTITVTAELELRNGEVIRPSVTTKEGEWGIIDLDGVGLKVRARRQGKNFVTTDYQLFLVNGKSRKDWEVSHVVASWRQRMAAHVPADKISRVRRMSLTSTLAEK